MIISQEFQVSDLRNWVKLLSKTDHHLGKNYLLLQIYITKKYAPSIIPQSGLKDNELLIIYSRIKFKQRQYKCRLLLYPCLCRVVQTQQCQLF